MSDDSRIVQDVTEIIKYTIYSDYLVIDKDAHEAVLSAIIVAPVEHGKTSILMQFQPTDGLLCMTNLTAYGLQHKYLKQLRSGSIKRVVVPDFINPANQKQETVNSLITFFNSYISWEGVGNIVSYAITLTLTTNLTGGLLTTMAVLDFQRMKKVLAATGFLSRLLVVGYQDSRQKVQEILLSIARGEVVWNKYNLPVPKEQVAVSMENELSEKLIPLAVSIGRRAYGDGFRAIHQLKVMCRAKALSEGRDEVCQEDVDRVLWLADNYIGRVPHSKPQYRDYPELARTGGN